MAEYLAANFEFTNPPENKLHVFTLASTPEAHGVAILVAAAGEIA